jgi:PAS domain-containing protein
VGTTGGRARLDPSGWDGTDGTDGTPSPPRAGGSDPTSSGAGGDPTSSDLTSSGADGSDPDERRAMQVLKTVPAPTVVTDSAGRVRFANASALELMGARTLGSLAGSFLDWVLTEDRSLLSRRLTATPRGPVGDLLVRLQARERVVPCLLGGAAAPEESPSRIVLVLARPGVWAPEPGTVDVATLSAALGALAWSPRGRSSGSGRMQRVVRWWRACTGETSEVHLWIRGRDGRDLHAGTSRRVRDWGAAQLDRGEGPVVTSWQDAVTVRSRDVGRDPRFPSLSSGSGSGPSAVSSPLTCAQGSGVVTVVDPDAHMLDPDDIVIPSLAAATSRSV